MDSTTPAASHATWTPPVYDMTVAPKCPDGSVALIQYEDATFRYPELPTELLGISVDATTLPPLPKRLTQPAPILDYTWYPSATIRDPASFCFVASVRECPVKLLDASDGRLRASYRIVDHRERQIAPHSVAFNTGANRLYCGFEDAIEVFDIHRPGEGTRLHTTPSKKSRDGLKGIVSTLAFAPDMSSDLYAAGSFSPSAPSSSNIAIFSESTGEVPVMFVGAEGQRVGAGYGVRASVSQLMFNPARPYLLYASFRRVEPIYCWDLRGDVTRPVEIFTTLSPTAPIGGKVRKTSTNQRLRFDIDYGGKWLAVGGEDGGISVFDLLAAQADTVVGENVAHTDSTPRNMPIMQYDGHHDAVGSVAFHPLRPLLLSVSGSRHFDRSNQSAGHSSEESEDEEEDEIIACDEDAPPSDHAKPTRITISRQRLQPTSQDSSVRLWGFGGGTGVGV
ncbi:WD40 repeat-like protein [Polyporus arcularius HHB13444]|uniref:WD40 repeat-like protein n=1 Tax=Polyporus arcularius HHB13444 TaxID=1314778 RepID=A0A5C3NV42_9APHY|nr:WD40 repeat-like protein [Polyporus arcularius HHB13444]